MDLRDFPSGEQLRASFDEHVPVQVDDGIRETHARGEVAVDRVGPEVRLRGHVAADLLLACSRCLRDVHEHVETVLDEPFSLRPAVDRSQGELHEEDFVNRVGPDQMLDVSDVVREHLQLAVPMAPLCRPDCKGLCPVCGANWNERTCEHGP